MSNPFDELGIPRSSSEEEARKAYRKLAMKYHPDRVAVHEQKNTEAKFKKVKEAWEHIENGWSEPTPSQPQRTYNSSFSQPQARQYHKPEDPSGTWRNKEYAYKARPKPNPRAQTYSKAPWESRPLVVEGYQVQAPKKNLGEYVARVSISEAFNGFIVEITHNGEKKQFKFPEGTPNNLKKDFDVDGGQISITAKFTQSMFKFKGIDNAVYENTIVNSAPSSVVRTGDLATSIEVHVNKLRSNHSVTMTDILGQQFSVQIPAGGSRQPIKVEGRGYVDWYPAHDKGGSKRGALYVHVIPVDAVPMNNLS